MLNRLVRLCFCTLLVSSALLSTQQPQQRARDLLLRALHLADLYNWDGASPLFARAEPLFRREGDLRDALYSHLGVLRTEPKLIRLRIKEIDRILSDEQLLQTDKLLRLFALEIKGDLDGEIDSEAARRDWTAVMQLARDLHIPKWIYRAQGQIGFADYYDGDIASCQRNVAAALIAATQSGDVGAQVFFLSATAIGSTSQGMFSQAIVYANKALDLVATTPDIGYPSVALQALISSLAETGEVGEAKRRCNQELAKALTPRARGNILQGQVTVALAEHNVRSAVTTLETLDQLTNALGESRLALSEQTTLASLYAQTGDLPKAEDVARRTLSASEANEPTILVPERHDTLAQILIRRGKYEEAKQLYGRAAEIQDTMIGKANSVSTKTALITGARSLYSNYFRLVAEHFHDVDAAYRVVEQPRGRIIADLLLSGKITSPKARAMELQIAQLRLQLTSARTQDEIHRIRNAIFFAEESRSTNPDITILSTNNFQPVDIHTVQQSLKEKEVILEYVLSDEKAYCLVISRLSARIVLLPRTTATIEGQVAEYLRSMKNNRSGQEEAMSLYRSLLAPIQEIQRNHDLIIVADGKLHLIPFDALIDDKQRYVVESKTVLYAPSTTTFYLLRKTRPSISSSTAVLAVGGVPYGHGEMELASLTRGYDPQKAWDLPASRDEALAVMAALPNPRNKLLIDNNATESAFKQALTYPFAFVHLAVHAFPNDNPDKAVLVLLHDPLHGEDGFLEASEIVQMHLAADLVVLSACDTAVGPIEGEEGISTLSTSFLLAGARNIVSTLWPIEDRPSSFLMKHFYAHLAQQQPPAESMAEAKREMLQTYGTKGRASYWAAFIVEGSNVMADESRSRDHKSVVAIGFVLVILLLALLWAYKNKFIDYP